MGRMLLLRGLITLVLFYTPGTTSQHEAPVTALSSPKATCPAKTVNYITHTLPQQCLASSRSVLTNATLFAVGSSYSSNSADYASASSQPITILEQSSLTSAIPNTSAVTAASSTQSSESPPRPTAELETKTYEDDFDSDLALGNGGFLSFEDWKRQNLAKSGQSEHVGKSRQNDLLEPRRKPVHVSDALDSLGDDAEIDLDFAGFAAERPDVAAPGQSGKGQLNNGDAHKEDMSAPVASRFRRTDAGTTCKERFNYASFDCAATVLKTNPQAKGASAVLSENKDSYMLNECSADNKFLILELCNDIFIDTVVLANFEFFSSIFRIFRVSVSDKYPIKTEKWKTLGTFEARNSREVQAFLVENPLIWARYLRIEFLTHYGSEFYCPVSLIRIHGTTMMEDYKRDLEATGTDDDEDEDRTGNAEDSLEPLIPEAIAEGLVQEEEARNQAASSDQGQKPVSESQPSSSSEQIQVAEHPDPASVELGLHPYNKTKEEMLSIAAAFNRSQPTCPSNFLIESAAETVAAAVYTTVQENATPPEPPSLNEQNKTSDLPSIVSNASSALDPPAQAIVAETLVDSPHATATSLDIEPLVLSSRTSGTKTTNATHVEYIKAAASSTQPLPAGPTIQESFFKSVQKRLQMLESNSSLSLQYIEEQSRNLRDAFGRVEQRQLSKTTTFLEYLNSTVLSELRDFRQQYDQLWQSTVIELDTQREQYQKEVLAINSRLAMLADEVVFQKRMSILQSILVLICLGLVLFSRGPMNNYLELPIVQNMLARSPSLRRLNSHMLQTPTESPATTRPSSSHKQNPPYSILKVHRSQLSEDSAIRPSSPTAAYSPPSPRSFDGGSDVEEVKELSNLESPIRDHDSIMRPSSSPPMFAGAEDTQAENWRTREAIGAALTNGTDAELLTMQAQRLTVEEATLPAKHLSFLLPDG